MSKRHKIGKRETKITNGRKSCPKCGQEKDTTEFGRDASRSDGRYTYCKDCRRNPNRQDREVLELAEKGLKRCTLCQKTKPFCAYDKDSSKRLGVTSRCKKCKTEERRTAAADWHANRAFIQKIEREGMTKCYRCSEVKPLETFLKNKKFVTGYSRLCLECNNNIRKVYRLHRKKSLRDYTKWEVFEDDEFTCYICEDVLSPDTPANHFKSLSIDHVIPVSRGGLDERDNVRTACLDCNRKKNDMGLEEFLLKIGA